MKKLVVCFGISLIAFASQAGYLLWFTVNSVDDGYSNVSSYLNELKDSSKISSFMDVYAQVVAVQGKNKTVVGTYGLTSEWESDQKVSVQLGDLQGASYSYYIEIATDKTIDEEGVNVLGYSTKVAYTDLASNGNITDDLPESATTATAWHGSSYKATPEPTSAMLMLIGVAGLALRRKQRKA